MKIRTSGDAVVSVPMPLYLLVEDVGWWQGGDGSAQQQPFRNRFSRRHCLADYQVLAELGRRLSMRIGIGMVMGEWDRSDYLKNIPSATWMGSAWDNSANRGPWLDETARFLDEQRDYLEIGLHGICHEFWENGSMQRSEFHSEHGIMRPLDALKKHLDAFFYLLEENNIHNKPRLFVPPALNHSFGNEHNSFQALLYEYGIQYVITSFARARQYSPPIHPMITWEDGVTLLERGEAAVVWHKTAAAAPRSVTGPVVPLHWANLLHHDPARNGEVINRWAELLEACAENVDYILAADVSACFRQAAACYFGQLRQKDDGVELDLQLLPSNSQFSGALTIKIEQEMEKEWRCRGAALQKQSGAGKKMVMEIVPDPGCQTIQFFRPKSP